MFFDMPRVRTRDADFSTSLTRSETAARSTASTVRSDQTLELRVRIFTCGKEGVSYDEREGVGLYMGEAIFASAGNIIVVAAEV
jgi:hypothetical protein